MPTTITVPGAGTVLGPGVLVQLSSDFIGPIQTGSFFISTIASDPEFTDPLVTDHITTTVRGAEFSIASPSTKVGGTGLSSVADGTSVHMIAELHEPGGAVIDGGNSITLPWQSTSGLQTFLPEYTEGGVQAGFTETDRQTLTDTASSTVLDQLVDALTLQEVTNGPTGDLVEVPLEFPFFAVIIRLDTFPDGLMPKTPDQGYFQPTLAVVRIYRGQDLWLRVPIHTVNRIIPLQGEGIVSAVAKVFTNLWLLQMSLAVSFLPGVTGRVFLMRFP